MFRRLHLSVRLLGYLFALLMLLGSLPALGAEVRDQELIAPYGEALEVQDLDGGIGSEWDDAARYDLVMGLYEATVLLKHDTIRFYIAMIVHTGREYIRGFEAYVVFDGGDGIDFTRGDDMLLARAEDGALVEADYYYRGTYNFLVDSEEGGSVNAYGAGRYDNSSRCYIFEMMRDIDSGDARDVPLHIEEVLASVYGWVSY